MEQIKNEILKILNYAAEEFYKAGYHGELDDPVNAIISGSFEDVSTQICTLVQAVFDPENQPNQFGIENPFGEKKIENH